MNAVRKGYRSDTDSAFLVEGCHVKWYHPKDACRVLKQMKSLKLFGDSFMRHIMQAMLTVLSGDYEHATSWKSTWVDDKYESCDGNGAHTQCISFIKDL
jgi:hypothetical protein